MTAKSRILVRFNTKHEEDPQRRLWRLLIDGVEHLASHVMIATMCSTVTEDVAPGVTKHHIYCWGVPEWTGTEVRILPFTGWDQ